MLELATLRSPKMILHNQSHVSIYQVNKSFYQTLSLIFESRIIIKKNSRLGAWIFAQSSGNCLGPWIGGILVEYLQNSPFFNPANLDPANSDYGFRATTLIFLCVLNIPMFLIDSYSLFRKWLRDQRSEIRRQGYESINCN